MPTRNISLAAAQDAFIEKVQLGVTALDRGDATEIDDSELERYLEALAAEARAAAVAVRLRRKQV